MDALPVTSRLWHPKDSHGEAAQPEKSAAERQISISLYEGASKSLIFKETFDKKSLHFGANLHSFKNVDSNSKDIMADPHEARLSSEIPSQAQRSSQQGLLDPNK